MSKKRGKSKGKDGRKSTKEEIKKIMVVDDEAHIRLLYSEELAEDGYEVVTAGSGERLLERIEEERPDLVVLDIKLGPYDGLDLLEDIKKQHPRLPVILCTAYDIFKEELKSVQADGFVVKSFALSELKRKIGRLL